MFAEAVVQRAVAVVFVELTQAQSIAPLAAVVGLAFLTKGINARVLPFKPVGMPFVVVAAIATLICQLPAYVPSEAAAIAVHA